MGDLQPFVLFLAAGSLAAATLVSEDLTCMAAGVLVAEGSLPFSVAVAGCLAGIVAGDVLLMLVGRVLGRRALHVPVVRRLVSADAIDRGSRWLMERGATFVAVSRFVPGTRLATYLAAGALGINVWKFTLYVTLTAIVWVPSLVGVSVLAGGEIAEAGLVSASGLLTRVVVAIGLLAGAAKLAAKTMSWRSRRRLYGFWQRCTRWEFWAMWVFYPPIVAYVIFQMLKHRSLTVFTAANPDIPGGGFIGESKFDILRGLSDSGDLVARAALVSASTSHERRLAIARGFMERSGLTFPVVIKPDQGQRGSGVAIVRSDGELSARIAGVTRDLIIQEYVPGLEFGVFYYRRPSDSRGRIFSITEKRFPAVWGDGRRTLEDLILADDRAVCLEHIHRRVHKASLNRVPKAGETVQLVEIGSHCRGSLFLDATHLVTPELEAAFDAVAQRFGGFYFGRFDVRAPSVEEFSMKAQFRIIELNGVSSEATNIYDPTNTVWTAYRVLRAQWRLAFEIGEENRRRGIAPTPVVDLLSLVRQYRRVARVHPEQVMA